MRLTREEFEQRVLNGNTAGMKVILEGWWKEYNNRYNRWELGMWTPDALGNEDDFEDFWREMRLPHYINNTVDSIVGIVNHNMEAYMLDNLLHEMKEDDEDYEKLRYWYHKRMMQWRVSETPDPQIYWWNDESYSETCFY